MMERSSIYDNEHQDGLTLHTLRGEIPAAAALSQKPQKKGKKRSALRSTGTTDVSNGGNEADDNSDGGQAMVFPVKLHRMLSIIDSASGSASTESREDVPGGMETDPSVVSWQPHGRCFLVHDKEAFVKRYLPSYFRQSKWASFQRQLNIYGFQRLTAGRDRGAYYHELFVRGHPELATRIHRMKLKGIGQGRHRTNAELEPDFYRMKPVGPGDSMEADLGIANALATARLQQQQQQHGTFHAAPALTNATSLNALNFFGGNNGAVSSSSTPNNSGTNVDLSNLYFLTSGGDLNQMNAVLLPQSQQESSFQAAQQGSANSSALLLANLFNANTGAINPNGAGISNTNGNGPTLFDMSNGSLQYHQPNDAGQLQDIELSNLRNLLQAADSNPLTAQTLMQYMADSNSDTSSQNPSAQGNPSSGAMNGSTQVHRQALNQPQQLESMDHSMSSNIGVLQDRSATSYNTDDLASSFRQGDDTLRRMSSLISSQLSAGNTSNEASAARYAATVTSPHFSSLEAPNHANLRLLSSLQDRHHSESATNLLQLLETANSTDAPGFTANEAINQMANSSNSHGQVGLQGPASSRGTTYQLHHHASAPVPASSQQYALLGSPSGGGGGASFSDLLGGSRMANAMSNPTFLDSVYEPIPIKDGTGDDGHQKPAERTSPSGSVNSHSLL